MIFGKQHNEHMSLKGRRGFRILGTPYLIICQQFLVQVFVALVFYPIVPQ